MKRLKEDLVIVNKILHHRLQSDDIKEILSQLSDADQAAFAEKVGRILNRTSALLEVSRKITEDLSLEKMLPELVEIISEFISAERATVFLHDPINRELFSRVAQGELNFEIRLPDHNGLVGACFQSVESLIVNDPYNDPRFSSSTDQRSGFKTRSVLCSPIKHKNKAIGVVQVLNGSEDGFDEGDLMTLEAIAQHAAIGFENARLYDQMTRARSKQQRLFDVTTALSKELQLKPLLIKVMEVVTSFLGADRSTLFLHDAESDELWSQVAQGSSEIRFPSNLGIAGAVYTQRETINIPDAYQDERFNSAFDLQTGYRTQTILCMPIFSKSNQAIGVIQVINKLEGIFTKEDERSLKAFAAQASIAIENAQLFEQVIAVKKYNEAILESMSNGVLTLDDRGRIITVNHAFTTLFGGPKVIESLKAQEPSHSFLSLCRLHIPWLASLIDELRESQERNLMSSRQVSSLDHPLELGSLVETIIPHHSNHIEDRSVNVTAVPFYSSAKAEPGTLLLFEDLSNEKRLKSTMSRYLPSEVADQLLKDGGESLGGSLQEATVLFSDIRRFTTISERIGPQETVKMLNDYFGVMVDIISDHNGILDKFIGDAIMAVFGAPLPSEQDAENAVCTAVNMLRSLDELNERRRRNSEPEISIGIGLNTGEVLSGNIGSTKRMDYTVIGDAVNLAARLEGATKGFGAEILISEFTAAQIQSLHPLREVDLLRVKGKSDPVRVYEVMTHKLERTPSLEGQLIHFEEGLSRYRLRDWRGALAQFERANATHESVDPLSRVYAERCHHFMMSPPPDHWDGVWAMKTK